MQLTVPQRTVADTESFPVDPDGVNRWLGKLEPLRYSGDAREVYRGLRHSNRLHNDVNRRRSVVACFIPTLRELHAHLMETCQAQPLPLTREFQRSAQLLDGLLREEAFAFKILIADSSEPRDDDIRRAMQALARQAEARVHAYRTIPEALLRDAHQLYALADELDLLDAAPGEDLLGTGGHYKYILLQTLADTLQQRSRQIAPLLAFLSKHANALHISADAPQVVNAENNPGDTATPDTGMLVVDLNKGARPVPAGSLLANSESMLRWIDVKPVLRFVDSHIARSKSANPMLLGSETLERQSLARLRVTLARSRKRRNNRLISNEPRTVLIGHKAICAHLHFAARQSSMVENDDSQLPLLSGSHGDMTLDSGWNLLNHSAHGAALQNTDCRAGLVQAGDLVSILPDAADDIIISSSGKSTCLLGVIRWIMAGDGTHMKIGVEYLAKGVMPVGITHTDSDDAIADDALVIACKVRDKILQTMLLPAYLYQPGDRLTATLNGKSRALRLDQSLQSNGLFSQFSLRDD